jgi:hypothetical protein
MRRLSAAILAAGLSLGFGHAAFAAPLNDEASRLAAVERDNGTLRKEIAALRERERLMTEKASVQQRVERRARRRDVRSMRRSTGRSRHVRFMPRPTRRRSTRRRTARQLCTVGPGAMSA